MLDRRMAEHGASLSRTKLLLYLQREGPGRAVDIASYLGMAPRSVTEAVDGLERDGLVRREPDASDRRAKRVIVTDAGLRAIAATEPLRLELVNQIFGSLEMDDRAQLDRILDRLSAAIDRHDGHAASERQDCTSIPL